MSDVVVEALNKIADNLAALNASIHAQQNKCVPLGFIEESPKPVTIYCNRGNGGLWYRLEYPANGGDPTPINIPQRCLTGRLIGFTFSTKEHRKKESIKMCLHVDADRRYILETGHETQIARCLYADIASMRVEDLRQPVTIEVKPAEAATVMFAKIYNIHGIAADSEALRNTDLREVATMAKEKLKAAANN